MRYTCDHSPDRTQMCITCMNYEARIHSLEDGLKKAKGALEVCRISINELRLSGDAGFYDKEDEEILAEQTLTTLNSLIEGSK